MALTKLTKDLSIISKLSDEPNDTDGLSAAELKAMFDEGSNSIKKYINGTHIPELEEELGKGTIPAGGTDGQILEKNGAADYIARWANNTRVKPDEVGIVVNSDQSTVSVSVGQFVIVRNSTIAGIADGLYTAAKAIPANTTIDGTYLAAVSEGGLNSVGAAIQALAIHAENIPVHIGQNEIQTSEEIQAPDRAGFTFLCWTGATVGISGTIGTAFPANSLSQSTTFYRTNGMNSPDIAQENGTNYWAVALYVKGIAKV